VILRNFYLTSVAISILPGHLTEEEELRQFLRVILNASRYRSPTSFELSLFELVVCVRWSIGLPNIIKTF